MKFERSTWKEGRKGIKGVEKTAISIEVKDLILLGLKLDITQLLKGPSICFNT